MKTLTLRGLLVGVLSLMVLSGCDSGGSDADIEYAAIGASDAFGIGASPLTNGYVYLIEDDLEAGGKDVDLENLGIPGVKTDEMNDLEKPLAERDNPDLITVLAGPNDLTQGTSVEEFRDELSNLLGDLRDNTKAAIFAGNVPNLLQLPKYIEDPDQDVTAERISAFNQVIAEEAAAAGAELVDLFSIVISDDLVSDDDGFHPSDKGHRALADAYLAKIRPAFGGG